MTSRRPAAPAASGLAAPACRLGPRALRVLVIAAVAGVSAGGCGPPGSPPPRRDRFAAPSPDAASLLLVTLDTFRADAAGCGGSVRGRTPHLDRLARAGLQWERAYASSPLTLPSHATMLTGLYPPRHGARSNGTFQLAPDVPTLPEALAADGFATGAFLGAVALASKFGLTRGFALYDDDIATGDGGLGVARRPGNVVVDAAIRWVRTLPRGTRRFEWVHLFDAHLPHVAPRARVAAAGGSTYLAAAAEADAHLGRRLRERALSGDESWVLVVGDHGESLGDHREDTHGLFLYGATVNVPFVLAPAPDGTSRGIHRGTFRTIDLPATAFELLGRPAEDAPGDGVSALRGADEPMFLESLYAYLHFGWSALSGVIDERWKYIEAPEPELYDLVVDPGEKVNVAAEHPERVERLADLAAELGEGDRRETLALDDTSREALESLGYVTTIAEETGDRPDPKRMVRVNELVMRATQASGAGDQEGARRYLARGLGLDPRNREIHRMMGVTHVAQGHWAAAADWFARCLELPGDDRDPYPHAQLGVCYLRSGRPDDARRHLEIALELDPHRAPAWSNLGVARSRLGDEEGARLAWTRALELDPELESAKRFLGR